ATNEYAGLKTDDQGYVLSHDIREQTLGCLRNVEAALKSVSLEISHLVDVTVFMKCKDDFARMNEVWNEFFKNKATPTRTTVFVSDLPGYNQIELKAIAFKPE